MKCVIFQVGKGILRSLKCDWRGVADIVPVDIPVNMLITVAWYTAVLKPDHVLIYHSTTGSTNPFTWGEMGKIQINTLSFNLTQHYFYPVNLQDFSDYHVSQGTKKIQYRTCPAGLVTYNFHSSCKHMHLSFKSICNKEHL